MFSNNHYNKNLKKYARELRSVTASKAEKLIWKVILSRRITGVRFLRQRPIDRFIVDFFAPEIGLIIEMIKAARNLTALQYATCTTYSDHEIK